MKTHILALLVLSLFLVGGSAAAVFTARIAKEGDRRLVLMAGVAAWLVLFGVVPFLVFAIAVGQVIPDDPPVGWEKAILNLLPFTLLASPVIGFVQGVRASSAEQD